MSPSTGSTGGNTKLLITGTNFGGTTAVLFGGVPAASYVVYNDGALVVYTPAHPAGAVDVVVTTPEGSVTATNFYTFGSAPTLSSVFPAAGPLGGSVVTITGTNLTSATSVTFGGSPAASFTVNSDTRITALTAPHSAGVVDVVVTSAGGSGTGVGLYTYAALPVVSAVSPTAGPLAGGATVTITGANFTDATEVTFGGSPATSFSVGSATQITATTPAHTVGIVDVVVTTAGGSGTGVGLYRYTVAPTVSTVSPTAGPLAGGATVTITGTNFTGATGVTFGASPATSFSVGSATQITATTPAHAAGIVDVVVTTPGGSGTGSGVYTYAAAPVVSAVSPTAGPRAGGASVTITGMNFTGTTAVMFGGRAASGMTVVSATSITATAPPGAGATHVTVIANGQTSATSAADQFTYVAPPSISMAFGAAVLAVNQSTSLTFTVANSNAGAALNGVAFTDNLPPGLAVAALNALSSTCGGTATATPGSASVTLSNGTVAASGACTISVNVLATAAGLKNNVTGPVSSVNGGAGGTASASMTVADAIPTLGPAALGMLAGLLLAGGSLLASGRLGAARSR